MDRFITNPVRIGVVQTGSVPGCPEQNVQILRQFAQQAKEAGCAAVCFPEGFLTGYDPGHAQEYAVPQDDPAVLAVSETAAELGIDVLAGFMEVSGRVFYINHSVFYPDSSVLPYRKTHLGDKERSVFAAGNRLAVFPLSCGLTAGFQVCVECHFPEITQTLSLRSAQVVFSPFASPGTSTDRERIWKTIIPARCYDNRVYLACCNQVGRRPSAGSNDPVPEFAGGCLVCGPDGVVIAEDFGGQPSLLTFDVDTALLQRYRSEDPSMKYRYFPAKRRPELYK
ncbi:MAG: hypothetical protein IJQ02_13425 [Oscillospiraceae bacterium]|nr:hypothetical protein [Bacillota bacterium]MBQ6294784.1 hypothetical protein [Bacillota bacterium]MBR0162269.1 hypothetical protein [Oscillospiraceae bacterium]